MMSTHKLFQSLKWLVLTLLRFYVHYSPIWRGKVRLTTWMGRLLNGLGAFEVMSNYGTRFLLEFPDDRGWEYIYSLGTYETGASKLCSRLLSPGAVAIDVGANLGWYTVLFAKLVGSAGIVHAFEPVPWVFQKLRSNVTLNGCENVVRLNNLAVGNVGKTLDLFVFQDRGHGETSAHKREDTSVASQHTAGLISLDDYVALSKLDKLDLIKVDVEGFEMAVLEGASGLLRQECRPMWLFEINLETSHMFDWSPYDLLRRLQSDYGYRFLQIKNSWGRVVPLNNILECRHGDNVLCYDLRFHQDNVQSALSTLG